MDAKLYRELVPWYDLVDPAADHHDEAASYLAAFERGASGRLETMLDLGAGAGNNVVHLKRRMRCTLADISDAMLDLSRAQNPECEHLLGDMRTIRLGRTFDAVLVHDAVMYMTTRDELCAAARTAFEHTRLGGAAVFAPDCVRETFHDATNLIEGDDGRRALRGLEWSWDPDSSDDTTAVEYAFLLRDGLDVKMVHDRHVEGLFSRAEWFRVLESVGFVVETAERRDEDNVDEIFLCRRSSTPGDGAGTPSR